MDPGDVEWHEPKRAANIAKHGIDFEDAAGIWHGPVANRQSSHPGEPRFITLGQMDQRIIAVVWTLRGDRRRLISARMARTHERLCYTAFLARPG